MAKSFFDKHSDMVFGTRLRRLSDRFLADIAKIYESLSLPFEPGWLPLFYLLSNRGKLSVNEIAAELEITHSAVSQMVSNLESRKLVVVIEDEKDRRKRSVSLDSKGLKLMEQLLPIWKAIRTQVEILLAEGEHSSVLTTALQELEENMKKKSIHDRVMNVLKEQ